MSELLTAAEGAALMGRPQPIPTTPIQTAPVRTPEQVEDEVGTRFQKQTANHRMTVLHDDGLYRHLWFMNPRSSEYWFEIVTWPGCLTFRGDVGAGYTFSRERDMFPFFRSRRGGINPHYWAEKLGGGRRSVKEYSEESLRQHVVERFVEDARWGGVPPGTGKAIQTWILSEDLSDERAARNVLEDFAHQGYEFSDVWEWDFHDYQPEFLWACHAIVWAIRRYDKVTRYGLAGLATPKATS